MSKKYLVIGSGGREHAIAWALSRDSESYVLPGNPGMVQDAQTVSGNPNDFEFVAKKAKELEIDTVVIGPEDPLCAGIADVLEKHGLKVFGPRKTASKLEGSKVFAKEFMKKHGIPTANSEVFSNEKDALEFIKKLIFPVVIKVDGLASGKGVQIVYNMFDAESVLHGIFSDCKFGASGEQIVIEEFLVGKELSILGVTDGNVIKPLPHSRDHKQLLDGNRGPMTGGMGAFCPVPGISSELFETIRTTILEKTLEGLKKDGIPYKGVIFFGLMLTDDGPKVLEYNCRFGDPETQVVLMQIETPLSEIVDAVVDEKLSDLEIKVKKGFSAAVVLASEGYPGSTKKGFEITGVSNARNEEHSKVFFAGVSETDGKLVNSGGRVLACAGSGTTLKQALGRAYRLTSIISFEGNQMRGDIGGRYARRRKSIFNFRLKIGSRGSQKGN